MTERYDVIIIGAGPGGLACAQQFSGSGLSVLLLGKNEIIGPKTCAGGLKNLDRNFVLPAERIRTFYQEEFTTKYKSYTLEFEKPLRTISRHDLGQYQAAMLEGVENINARTGVRVKEIREGMVITSVGNFSFKYLVGADGSNSMVRRHLGLETKKCIGMYYEIPGMTDKVIWHFNPEEIRSEERRVGKECRSRGSP